MIPLTIFITSYEYTKQSEKKNKLSGCGPLSVSYVTQRFKLLILGRDIGWGGRCAISCFDLYLTLTFKILFGLYLTNSIL